MKQFLWRKNIIFSLFACFLVNCLMALQFDLQCPLLHSLLSKQHATQQTINPSLPLDHAIHLCGQASMFFGTSASAESTAAPLCQLRWASSRGNLRPSTLRVAAERQSTPWSSLQPCPGPTYFQIGHHLSLLCWCVGLCRSKRSSWSGWIWSMIISLVLSSKVPLLPACHVTPYGGNSLSPARRRTG